MAQDELKRKDEAKLKGIRDWAAERTGRFMNSRERCIGINKAALDEQVETKRQNILAERKHPLWRDDVLMLTVLHSDRNHEFI